MPIQKLRSRSLFFSSLLLLLTSASPFATLAQTPPAPEAPPTTTPSVVSEVDALFALLQNPLHLEGLGLGLNRITQQTPGLQICSTRFQRSERRWYTLPLTADPNRCDPSTFAAELSPGRCVIFAALTTANSPLGRDIDLRARVVNPQGENWIDYGIDILDNPHPAVSACNTSDSPKPLRLSGRWYPTAGNQETMIDDDLDPSSVPSDLPATIIRAERNLPSIYRTTAGNQTPFRVPTNATTDMIARLTERLTTEASLQRLGLAQFDFSQTPICGFYSEQQRDEQEFRTLVTQARVRAGNHACDEQALAQLTNAAIPPNQCAMIFAYAVNEQGQQRLRADIDMRFQLSEEQVRGHRSDRWMDEGLDYYPLVYLCNRSPNEIPLPPVQFGIGGGSFAVARGLVLRVNIPLPVNTPRPQNTPAR